MLPVLLTREIDFTFVVCLCSVGTAGASLIPSDYKQPPEFGSGTLYLDTPVKAADRKPQTEHLTAWPIDQIRPYRTPNFNGTSGPVPTHR